MSTQARARKPAAAKTKAAAAAAETKPEPRAIEFRSLTLTVPPISEWSSELYFLMGELDGGGIAVSVKVLTELIGADQFAQVREKLRDDRVPFAEVENELGSLFDLIYESYGTSTGESEASPGS